MFSLSFTPARPRDDGDPLGAVRRALGRVLCEPDAAELVPWLALLPLVPRKSILGFDFPGRLLWTLLAVPLPIFFAGIIFSTTFHGAAASSSAFGANVVGAMVGGFCEYLVMLIGNHRLSPLVMAAYLGSLGALTIARRTNAPF